MQTQNDRRKKSGTIQPRVIPLWPDAGKALGLSRNGTYEAAKRGEIPTIRFGWKIVVPVDRFERLLAGEHPSRGETA
jgi:hypothetical protein